MSTSRKNSAADQKDSSPAIAANKLPPLKALVAFEAAARHCSFSRGAEELRVTPSAVSHHIQQLEDFLGVQLFQRHAGRAALTTAGHAYAREIAHAFELITGATRLIAPQDHANSLVVASSVSFAAKWLQPRLCDFLKSNASLKIRLTTLSHLRDLDDNRFDIAICYGAPAAGHASEPLLVETLRPLCCPDVVASLDLRIPADLRRATLIHSANSLTWTEYFRRAGCDEVKPNHELWFDRSTMAIDAAARGLGLVLESEILAEQELREGRLVAPFPGPSFQVEVPTYFLVKAGGSMNRRHIALFENWLRLQLSQPSFAAAAMS